MSPKKQQPELKTIYDPATRLWTGVPITPKFPANTSVATAIFESLDRYPDNCGQINDADGSRLSNRELRDLAVRIALNLRREEGVQKGDVIGIVAQNHRLVASIAIGCMALAAPMNTLAPSFTVVEIAHMFGITRPKVVFCDADIVETVRQALVQIDSDDSVALYTVDRRVVDVKCAEDLCVAVGDEEAAFVPTDIVDGASHPLAIVCSSGTTGLSKGVFVSHALFLERITGPMSYEVSNTDVIITFSYLYWITGLINLVSGCLTGMTRVITTNPFGADYLLSMIEKYDVNVMLSAPIYFALLEQSPKTSAEALANIRLCICGGGNMPPELHRKFNALMPVPVRTAYALSEGGGMVTGHPDGETVYGSVGQMLSNTQAQIVNEEGQRCGVGEDGEIWVRLQYPVLGYCGNVEETQEVLDAEGWMHTGDVGHFDENGYLFVVDRIKDFVRSFDVRVSPTEVENVVREVAGVSQVCVVGLPDGIDSEAPAAVVVRRPDASGERLRAEEIEELVRGRLSERKHLRGGVFFVEHLPLTSSGKVKRREVQDMAIRLRDERVAV